MLTLLAIAATAEGLLRRCIREAGFRQPSATAHHAAQFGLLMLPPLLGLLLFVPLPLPQPGTSWQWRCWRWSAPACSRSLGRVAVAPSLFRLL